MAKATAFIKHSSTAAVLVSIRFLFPSLFFTYIISGTTKTHNIPTRCNVGMYTSNMYVYAPT